MDQPDAASEPADDGRGAVGPASASMVSRPASLPATLWPALAIKHPVSTDAAPPALSSPAGSEPLGAPDAAADDEPSAETVSDFVELPEASDAPASSGFAVDTELDTVRDVAPELDLATIAQEPDPADALPEAISEPNKVEAAPPVHARSLSDPVVDVQVSEPASFPAPDETDYGQSVFEIADTQLPEATGPQSQPQPESEPELQPEPEPETEPPPEPAPETELEQSAAAEPEPGENLGQGATPNLDWETSLIDPGLDAEPPAPPPAVPAPAFVDFRHAIAAAMAQRQGQQSAPEPPEPNFDLLASAALAANLGQSRLEPSPAAADLDPAENEPASSATRWLDEARQRGRPVSPVFEARPQRPAETLDLRPPVALAARAPAAATTAPSYAAQPTLSVPEAPPYVSPASKGQARSTPGLLRRIVRWTVVAAVSYVFLVMGLVLLYRYIDPPASTLMVVRVLQGAGAEQTWVPLDEISPHLVSAVIVSEDGRFCQHWGIDLVELGRAIEQAGGGGGSVRGASTISMQVAKNLFLLPTKSIVRKAIEVPLALMIDYSWPKQRTMEIYLNIAEWGPGIFGAEAAAQYHFGKSASRLSEREAALLAVTLPNPIARVAGDPGPGTARRAGYVQSRMRASGPSACLGSPVAVRDRPLRDGAPSGPFSKDGNIAISPPPEPRQPAPRRNRERQEPGWEPFVISPYSR